MWRTHGNEVQFLVVYVREAHALDSFLPKGGKEDPILEDPATLAERQEVAQTCLTTLDLEPMPAVVDTLDDAACRAYDAWPDRLYLIGRDGRVAYQGGPGPDEFFPEELQAAISEELGLNPELALALPAPAPKPEPSIPRLEGSETLSGIEWLQAKEEWAKARGYRKDASGTWVRSEDLDPQSNGRFPCGDQWLSEEDANDYHSRLLRWWRIPSENFVAYSTCSRTTTDSALQWMESTRRDLHRLFGVEPAVPSTVILLRSLIQYNDFSVTRPDGEQVPPTSSGYSALHHAFPCEQWLDVRAANQYPGAACAYWDDRTEAGNLWGPLAVRHAAAHAFVEGIDPSPLTTKSWQESQDGGFSAIAFWSEKKVPLWLRYGAAMYCERFFIEEDAGDPQWARRWSMQELADQGGIGPLEALFRFNLDEKQVYRSRKLMMQAGAVVAFLLDARIPALDRQLARFQEELGTGEKIQPAVDALHAELLLQRKALEHFVKP